MGSKLKKSLVNCLSPIYIFSWFPCSETEQNLTASSSAYKLRKPCNVEECVTSPSRSFPPVTFKPPSDLKATSRLSRICILDYQLNFPAWSTEGSNANCISPKSRNPKDLYKAFSPSCGYLEFMPHIPCQFPVHSFPCRIGMRQAVAKSSSNLATLWWKTANVHQLDDQDMLPPHPGQFNAF